MDSEIPASRQALPFDNTPPLPEVPPVMAFGGMRQMLADACEVRGRHYLPVAWLRLLVAAATVPTFVPVPYAKPETAQQVFDTIMNLARSGHDPQFHALANDGAGLLREEQTRLRKSIEANTNQGAALHATIEKQRRRIEELEREAPRELTPAEKNAELLLGAAKQFRELLDGVLDGNRSYNDRHNLGVTRTALVGLLELIAPKPATVQELAEAVREMMRRPHGGTLDYLAASRKTEEVLERVPK